MYPPAVSSHLSSVKNAVQMLRQRVEILKQYLRATKDGSVPMNHRLLRQVASVCAQLPAVNVGEFESQFLDVRKHDCDVCVCVCVCMCVCGTSTVGLEVKSMRI